MPKDTQKKENPDQNQILIGLDFGEKNIGVAMGRNGLVAPVKIVSGVNKNMAIHELTRIALENKALKFVIGLPLTSEGKETQKSIDVRKFAKLLKVFSKKPVDFQDEHSTSQTTTKEAIKINIPKKGRENVDHLAAALILKRYYQEKSESSTS